MKSCLLRAFILIFSALAVGFLSLSPRSGYSQNNNSGSNSIGADPNSQFQAGYNDGLKAGLSSLHGTAQAQAATTIPPVDSGQSSSGGGC